jgi:hypothetical protein
MEKGADQENLKRPPLCGKLHDTTTKQEPLCLSLSLSLSPSGLVVALNPGFAQIKCLMITHVTSNFPVFRFFGLRIAECAH